jgi:alkyl hydroperoxide reductase subunit AhpF
VGDEYVTGLDLVSSAGQTRTLAVEGVFVELGLLPNSQLVREWAPLNDDGHVIINHRCETSVPGLFAAGDVTNVYAEQVPVSIGEGVKAALSAWSYLASSAAGHR